MHMTPYQPIEVAERTLSTSASTLDRWHSLAVEVAASEVRGSCLLLQVKALWVNGRRLSLAVICCIMTDMHRSLV